MKLGSLKKGTYVVAHTHIRTYVRTYVCVPVPVINVRTYYTYVYTYVCTSL